MSELAQQLIEINLVTKDPELDLGCCGLDGTEESLFTRLAEADHLHTLILSDECTIYNELSGNFMISNTTNKGPSSRITHVPSQLPTSLQKLVLGKVTQGAQRWELKNTQAISQLKHLRVLHLYSCVLDDLSFLQDLPQLQELDLSELLMEKPPVIGKLDNLKSLTMHNCGLGNNNLAFLKTLKNLRHVDFSYNYLTDLSSFSSLSKLTSFYVANNHLPDLTSLKHFPQLEALQLQNNEIHELDGIEHLSNLRHLNLEGNLLDELDPLQHLPQLELLSVKDNLVEDLSPIAQLTQLRYLDVSDNGGLDIAPLKNLKSLETLDLYSGALDTEDILFLKDFKQLKRLNLDDNDLESLDLFKYMPQLQMLNLSNNEIENIDDLWGLTNLQWLNINNNQIENIDCLQLLDNLLFLMMSNNRIKEIESLKHLSKLRVLDIGGNHIKDVTPLVDLPELGVIRLNPKSLSYLPMAFVLACCQGEFVYDLQKEAELPAIQEIYPLMVSSDKSYQALAAQLMKSNQWTPDQIDMYYQTIEFYEGMSISTDDKVMELFYTKKI
ncbi:leucine-rich repeat domain-containing protein [Microscilla marina]|uniref:Possible surface protein, responsible for cell interaction contains cell adhesion domain and ChW-repeats n=1 Tax=Microscilla marina ATCC 23134 TaxID=313606 RepID=A1ZYM6_MICM2|nr:leucine-rich repeat domain-containing protein [Microscilla marina]EAY24529.1 possible surface protein, responsible for cell interaction; contains cell adhesion domain and ChW-repeats [Microscilla marina ATCC 23134]